MLFGLAGHPFGMGTRTDNRRPLRIGCPRQLASAESAAFRANRQASRNRSGRMRVPDLQRQRARPMYLAARQRGLINN